MYTYRVKMVRPYQGTFDLEQRQGYQTVLELQLQDFHEQGFELVAVWPQQNGWAIFIYRRRPE